MVLTLHERLGVTLASRYESIKPSGMVRVEGVDASSWIAPSFLDRTVVTKFISYFACTLNLGNPKGRLNPYIKIKQVIPQRPDVDLITLCDYTRSQTLPDDRSVLITVIMPIVMDEVLNHPTMDPGIRISQQSITSCFMMCFRRMPYSMFQASSV